jgi:hypothetical protein
MTRDEAINFVKASRERFEKTREIQWKMNVAIWTLMAAAIYLFAKEPSIRFTKSCTLIFLAIVFGITHLLFVYIIQRSLETSKSIEDHIFTKLNEQNSSLQQFEVDIRKLSSFWSISPPGLFWLLFQMASTTILLIIFVHINLT